MRELMIKRILFNYRIRPEIFDCFSYRNIDRELLEEMEDKKLLDFYEILLVSATSLGI